MSKFLNISTDTTLGGNSASDSTVSSQKAIKAYVDSQTGTAPAFANITGQPTDNTNLATALNAKQDTLVSGTTIKTVGGASLLGSGNIALPTKTSDLTNDSGYITGITSSDVTTALGYTPYNSSNPAGYTSNVGTVTSVNNTQPVNGNVTLSIPTVNNATLTITQGGTAKGTFTANASSNVTIDLDSGGGASRNIGEIVQSTIPLTDAGLHLLNGGVIQRGSYADFVDYIAGLVSTYPDIFTTEANWQQSVTDYGVCGKFVYDSTNQTVRLPKITGFTEGTTDLTALGDLIQAGLPNITGKATFDIGGIRESSTPTGAFYKTTSFSGLYGSARSTVYSLGMDASRSNSVYGNSTTVQPQSIKVLYYIVIATSTKTSIEVDIDEIATDLNGKADVDLSNMNPTQTVKNTIVGWGMPDYSAGISLSYNSFVSYWTAPSDGVICGKANWNSSTNYLTINGSIVQGGNTECYGIFFFVSKGDVVHNDSGVIESGHTYLTFYPLKGV